MHRDLCIGLVASTLGLSGACGGDRNGGESQSTGLDAGGTETDDSDASQSDSDSDSDTDAEGSGASVKFDVNAMPDLGAQGCNGMGGDAEFSYIWVANSSQDTISKLNTQTLVEEGRYVVRPDSMGSPSRTSVNLSGDVAIANRDGGITKIYALAEDCVESNNMPGLQTSTGINDVLPWGIEECVAWHTPFPYTTQRPVAWAAGNVDPNSCTYGDEKLWTAGGYTSQATSLVVHRLNGTDGAVEDTINMPDVPMSYFGAYGGAVNQAGDFWFVVYDRVPVNHLVRVDAETLAYDIIQAPATMCAYGFTVDSKGRPWIGSFCDQSARYDPDTDTWNMIPALGYGIQEDADGSMWLADYGLPGVRQIDSDTLALGAQVMLPASSPKGISIDFYGKVWVVDMSQNAFRVDPDTLLWDVYNQLNGPYTYSDMTGWGLANVVFPPG